LRARIGRVTEGISDNESITNNEQRSRSSKQMSSNTSTKPRGFAAMDPERRREISRKGGVTAHRKGTAHEWDSSAATEAGRKGGLASRTKHPSRPSAAAVPQPANDAGLPAEPSEGKDEPGTASGT
jgi:general stress protein YciG